MHGGNNKGAPTGNRNAWRHGNRSTEAEAQLKLITQADRELRLISRVRENLKLRPSEQSLLIQLMDRHGSVGSDIDMSEG